MSDLIRVLNLIKTRRNLTWLTASQQGALAALRKALRVPGTVNLFGAEGVGKTFLAWVLAAELGYTYVPHISHLERDNDLQLAGVVVDNCQPGRLAHRDTLKMLRFQTVRRAVLVTRQIVDDYTYYVELGLTSDDQAKAQDNLASIGLFHKIDKAPNLWHLVNPHL